MFEKYDINKLYTGNIKVCYVEDGSIFYIDEYNTILYINDDELFDIENRKQNIYIDIPMTKLSSINDNYIHIVSRNTIMPLRYSLPLENRNTAKTLTRGIFKNSISSK